MSKKSDLISSIEDPVYPMDEDPILDEPEVPRAVPEMSIKSFGTPSQNPWTSHGSSVGSRRRHLGDQELLSIEDEAPFLYENSQDK